MKTKLLALLALCSMCFAADPPKQDAAAIAKERHDRSQLAGEFRRKVEVLTAEEIAAVKAILAKHPDKVAPVPAKPAPKP